VNPNENESAFEPCADGSHLFAFVTSVSKKGTGSEPADADTAKNSGGEVPVPLLQQAAIRDGHV
jgi:hypothetical protein